MTPKEQAIKKAYENKYDTFKDEMDENGWVIWEPDHESHPRWNEEKEFYEWCCPDSGFDQFRPKSLNGLEDNRGWISVEDRLPEYVKGERGIMEDETEYWIYTKWGNIFTAYWDPHKEYGDGIHEWPTGDWSGIPLDEVTHWQPVVKPEPPIY